MTPRQKLESERWWDRRAVREDYSRGWLDAFYGRKGPTFKPDANPWAMAYWIGFVTRLAFDLGDVR